MSDIPRIFTPEYYDEEYFVGKKGGKRFRRPNGSINQWSYYNPTGEWLGCKPIVEAWKKIFNPRNLLDCGCGRGTFVAYARDIGIEAYGFDFSKWAIYNHYPRCENSWLQVADVRYIPFKDNSFDLVVALDLMEHIYIDDVDQVISEIFRVCKKYAFFEIATSERGFIIRRGEKIPVELEANAVAGHVTVQPKEFWIEKFEEYDWFVRRDLEHYFRALVPPEVLRNWNCIIILEKW